MDIDSMEPGEKCPAVLNLLDTTAGILLGFADGHDRSRMATDPESASGPKEGDTNEIRRLHGYHYSVRRGRGG